MNRLFLILIAASIVFALVGRQAQPVYSQVMEAPKIPTFPPTDTPKTTGPTPTPPGPPATLDGIWEVQLQRPDKTTYSHFKFAQNTQGVFGIWRLTDGKIIPISGSYDGHQFSVVATMPDKTTVSFSGYVDSPTDMIGLADFGKETVPFTAAHRDKVRFMQDIGPGLPGGK